MLTLPAALKVFAKTTPTDMRKSFDGLMGLVELELELGQTVESGHLFLFFNRRRIEHRLPAEELPCESCHADRIIIREQVTSRLEIEPAKAYVIEEVQYTYACADCRDGSQMKTSAKPPQAVEKSPFGASVLALLVTWKFAHHLPTYRHQELLLGPLRQWLSRPLLCGLLMRTAVAVLPLARLIRQKVLESASVNVDETPGKMLKPGLGKTITGQVLGCAGDAEHPYVFYHFHTDHSRARPEILLEGYQGYLQTDGHVVYESLVKASAGRLVDVACWAHGRRGFDEALMTTSHVLTHEMTVRIQQLYDLESRAINYSAADRRALRQAEALPILQRMKGGIPRCPTPPSTQTRRPPGRYHRVVNDADSLTLTTINKNLIEHQKERNSYRRLPAWLY